MYCLFLCIMFIIFTKYSDRSFMSISDTPHLQICLSCLAVILLGSVCQHNAQQKNTLRILSFFVRFMFYFVNKFSFWSCNITLIFICSHINYITEKPHQCVINFYFICFVCLILEIIVLIWNFICMDSLIFFITLTFLWSYELQLLICIQIVGNYLLDNFRELIKM